MTDESLRTRDSSAINITESIQHSIDSQALYFEELQRRMVLEPVVLEPSSVEPQQARITETITESVNELVALESGYFDTENFHYSTLVENLVGVFTLWSPRTTSFAAIV